MSEKELADLLEIIRKNNVKHDITGMLLYRDGNVMQVIEGEQHRLEQLFTNIELDNRHVGIIKMFQKEIPHRDFGEWSMSYRNLSGQKIEGFSDFISSGVFSEQEISRAKKLLLSFRG